MEKFYKGKIPSQDDGWELVKKIIDDDIEWMVFRKDQPHTADWKTYKIVANGKALSKANYWMASNAAIGKVGFSRDLVIMRENRPALHARVEKIIMGVEK